MHAGAGQSVRGHRVPGRNQRPAVSAPSQLLDLAAGLACPVENSKSWSRHSTRAGASENRTNLLRALAAAV
jgi:hypothetical protein